MSTISVQSITGVTSFDFSNTTFANAYNVSNGAYVIANSGYGVANSGYGVANASYTFGNTVYAATNSVFGVANAAFAKANTALQNTSGTLAGNLTLAAPSLPLVINSTNSNQYKVTLQDSGSIIGYLGGMASVPFAVANTSVTTLFSVDSTGNANVYGTLIMSSPFSMRNKIINGYMGVLQLT